MKGDYGFADGVRYAFLDTEEELIFARRAYESIVISPAEVFLLRAAWKEV